MKSQLYSMLAVAALSAGVVQAQTQVDLTRQGKLASGTALPATCALGHLFLKSDPATGPTLYVCTYQGLWTAVAYNAGQGISFSGNTIAADDAVVPTYYTGSGSPSIDCAAGRDFYVDVSAGSLYYCRTSGQWQALSAAGHTHSAADLTSGTLNPSLLPAAVVVNSQPNTYAAGQRQSLTHDSTSAGLRIVPAPGDPSNPQDGDVWYNMTTGRFRRRENGTLTDWATAGSASHNLLSATHSDTTAANVARGDLITGQGTAANWARLALGTAGSYLRSNGTDLVYGKIPVSDLPAGYAWTGLANVPASFTPALHAATHQNGGSDEIATTAPAANAIPKAGPGGTLAAGWLPNPSATALGGVQSLTASSHRWINAISTAGVPSATQPACGDLSNAAASCSTDTTNAANISSGTLPAARLPVPGTSSLGGVESKDCTGTGHVLKINTDGSVGCSADATAGGSVTAGAGMAVSGSTVSWNPLDTSMDWLYDNFAPVGSASNNNVGLLRWNFVAASTAMPAGQGAHSGLFQWATSATANNVAYLTLFGAGNGSTFLPVGGGPFAATNWEEKWVFKTPASSANLKLRIGLLPGTLNSDFPDSNGVYVRYANDGGTACSIHGSDTGWVAFAGDGANTVSGSLGSFSNSTWYTLGLKSTGAGQIVFTLTPDGNSPSTVTLVASGGSPGAVVMAPMFPTLQMVTCDTTGKTVIVDEFRWLQTGIGR